VIYAFPVRIANITWANYTVTAAQNCVVQDANGKDIMRATTGGAAGAQMQVVSSGFVGWTRGLKVPTLDSGELTIAVGAGK
jgi:hypothetical protein